MKTVDVTYRYEAGQKSARPHPANFDAARHRLDEGNRTFAALLDSLADDHGAAHCLIPVDASDLGILADGASPEQKPFAAVLGCSDARVPIELIFNQGPNDLFVVRIAGNGVGSEVLGSLHYAIEHLDDRPKIIVVLGHSRCGAVSAAVDVFLKPERYLPLTGSHALRTIIDRLLVVVHASARKLTEIWGAGVTSAPRYREALIEAAIVVNAALGAYTLQHEISRLAPGGLQAVYGVYLLESRKIWAPHPGHTEWSGLADPPSEFASFAELANAVAKSERITSLLQQK